MTSALLLASRLVLAAVFAAAAAAKLADRKRTQDAVVAFGAPAWSAATLALVLPLAELAVAVLLLPSPTAVVGGVGALVLLAVFTTAIAWNLAHGRAPDCNCFGQLHARPVSGRTLVRNGGLAVLALVAVAGTLFEPPTSAVAWLGDLEGSELVALAVGSGAVALITAGAAAFLSLLRSYGSVLVRLERVESALAEAGIDVESRDLPQIGLEPGTPAPAFWTKSLTGEEVSVESLTSLGRPGLLLFTSPHCGPCNALLPRATRWQQEYRDELTVVFVSDGVRDDVLMEAEEHGLERVLLDEGRRLSASYEANGTPSAVVIAPDGTVGSWVAAGADAIEALVDQLLTAEGEDAGLPVGVEAPSFELPSLDGDRIALEELRGRDTLLLFWNPDCGFCRSLHGDIVAWEQTANGVTPRLVVVSSGDDESTRAEGFRSLVLLDEDFSAGSAFSANGTPMAVLVDADGRIGSPLAAGAEAVLALAGGHR